MGLGDELMTSGEARRRAAGQARRFQVLDKKGEPRWHALWADNPHIAKPGEAFDEAMPGYINRLRPYLATTTHDRFVFKDYQPAPAPLVLTEHGRAIARHAAGAVVFNPTIKLRGSPNKDWGLARWKVLVAQAPNIRWLQIGETPNRVRGAETLQTASFADAYAAIAGAAVAVVHEGALHHAAAAFGTPTVVIRGGFISPKVTGYPGHVDLYVEHKDWPLGCGKRVACRHCVDAMAAITPERVLAAVHELLRQRKAA